MNPEEERAPCPCRLATPCSNRCTCINGASSRGCRMCCSYGSLEQKRAKARSLVHNANVLDKIMNGTILGETSSLRYALIVCEYWMRISDVVPEVSVSLNEIISFDICVVENEFMFDFILQIPFWKPEETEYYSCRNGTDDFIKDKFNICEFDQLKELLTKVKNMLGSDVDKVFKDLT